MTPFLQSREFVLLVGGAALAVLIAFVVVRALRSVEHGWSIRLQLFFAILLTSLLAAGVVGLWVVDRVQSRHMELLAKQGVTPAFSDYLIDFGPKATLLFILLTLTAAGAAVALGRGVARPLERLARSAETIARGERHAVLPAPVGREVRRLTTSFESMRRALAERHEMEQFVADLSHELKNPVSAIRAATEVLQEGADEDPEARERFLGRIEEASGRLEVLLDDLLALARLEARGIELDPEPVALDDVLREAIDGHEAALQTRGITVDASDSGALVPGNARWLRRAFDNLLNNALRYTPRGGRIELRVRTEADQVVVTISDDGPGVAPKMRARAFERFATDRAHAGGTGLGLAIVRSVAELHGGGAELVGETGARFEVRLHAG